MAFVPPPLFFFFLQDYCGRSLLGNMLSAGHFWDLSSLTFSSCLLPREGEGGNHLSDSKREGPGRADRSSGRDTQQTDWGDRGMVGWECPKWAQGRADNTQKVTDSNSIGTGVVYFPGASLPCVPAMLTPWRGAVRGSCRLSVRTRMDAKP